MWIKICGNTRLEDALLAAELGASALGFIFAPGSRRIVSLDTAREISNSIRDKYPDVARIGVFTQANAGNIVTVSEQVNLSAAQFHGDAAQSVAPEVRAALPDVRHVAAFAWAGEEDFLRRVQGDWDMLLVDAPSAKHFGGTGQVFDWREAQPAFALAAQRGIRVIAAGGLTSDNVRAAIETLHPYGVDVASGVESAPGIKDAAKLRAFFAAARG